MRATAIWTAISAGALLAAAPAIAEVKAPPDIKAPSDIKAGADAWSRGDYPGAVARWQGPAAAGDPDAQFNLGQAYRLGRGVERDLGRAEELFGKAAAQGHVPAADNYGLLMFDRGARAAAMPYVRAASDRGDPRAQYLMGIAHFNGDLAPKDWVRAYALMSLAQGAGLAQAAPAIQQMDSFIPLAQRQEAARLAPQIAQESNTTRAAQFAAGDLGTTPVGPRPLPEPSRPVAVPMQAPSSGGAASAGADHARPAAPPPSPLPPAAFAPPPPRTATAASSAASTGADYARPAAPPPPPLPPAAFIPPKPRPAVAAAPATATKPSAPPAATPKPAPSRPVAVASGPWRVQLGAFAVPANADALWARVSARPELAGHARINVKAGRAAKLQAGGFASQSAAAAACAALGRAGYTCITAQE